MIDLGIIGYVQKGEYDATTSYEPMNCVYYNGGTYSAKQNTTGHAPTTGDENDQYWQTVVDPYGGSINGLDIDGTNSTDYGVCSTAGATAAKTVSIGGTFTLYTGAGVTVKFSNSNTATNPTLNVNDTGAKAIYFAGAAIDPKSIVAGIVYTFKYNGTQWDLVGSVNSGHTIKDDDGTTFTNRANLVFENIDVDDDSTNDATIIKDRFPIYDTLNDVQTAINNGTLKDGDKFGVRQGPGETNVTKIYRLVNNINGNSQEYDSTATYAVGNYCIYNSKLYCCKTAISTPEEFNSSKWDVVDITTLNNTKQSKTLSAAIAGQTTVEGSLSSINTSLSDKVSKAGDTMTGNLTVKSSNASLTVIDMNGSTERHKVFAGFANSSGDFYIWDNTKSKAILYSKADGSIVSVNGTTIPNNSTLITTSKLKTVDIDCYIYNDGWTQSSAGKYYSSVRLVANDCAKILAITIKDFGNMSADAIITPSASSDTTFSFMSNIPKTSMRTDIVITVRVLYLAI